MIGAVSVPAAVAILGADLFANQTWRVSSKPRRLRGLAMAGSTAAGDCEADLFVDQYHVGHFFNLAAGFPLVNEHTVPLAGNYVPPGATVALIVANAAVANPINVILL